MHYGEGLEKSNCIMHYGEVIQGRTSLKKCENEI